MERDNAAEIIRKDRGTGGEGPNLQDYERERARFSWSAVRDELAVQPDGGLNIAYQAVDRHALGPWRDRIALRWLGRTGTVQDLTFGELSARTSRFASLLADLGVGKGDRVFSLCGRIPELYIAALGTLKAGAVFCPLFASFGPEPIRTRLRLGDARLLVTTARLYRRKVEPQRSRLPALRHVLLAGEETAEEPAEPPDTARLQTLLAAASDRFVPPRTDPEDPALLHFTSGTTGTPKGALHVHQAVLVHHLTGRWALDLRPSDVFWCTADPGWVTGTSYGVVAPLTNGVTLIADEAEFDVDRWYATLAEQQVSVWYTAPTALRMLMKFGSERARRFRYPRLRLIASVGEPLNPQAVRWGQEVFGLPVHDTWWQTETGGIMIANLPALDIKPGAMGKPLPGIDAAIVRRRGRDRVELLEAGVEGELALRRGWPSMFRGYLHDEPRYAECFAGDWYLTGDLARRDRDGDYWFVGREDDAIQSAGHLIGPFEVENVLMEHPAVAEVGAIGLPDPLAHEVVHAVVTLKPGYEPGDTLRDELLALGRRRLGPAVAPRGITFRDALPKTGSGKILRRVLKAQEVAAADGSPQAGEHQI